VVQLRLELLPALHQLVELFERQGIHRHTCLVGR